jgi:hypothetical protein
MILIIVLLIIVIIMQSIALESLLKISRQETGFALENLELYRKVKELTEKNNEYKRVMEQNLKCSITEKRIY